MMEKFEIGQLIALVRYGSDTEESDRAAIETIDLAYCRLKIRSTMLRPGKSIWVGYVPNERGWRLMSPDYSERLDFDKASPIYRIRPAMPKL